jgi:hypothetical protein
MQIDPERNRCFKSTLRHNIIEADDLLDDVNTMVKIYQDHHDRESVRQIMKTRSKMIAAIFKPMPDVHELSTTEDEIVIGSLRIRKIPEDRETPQFTAIPIEELDNDPAGDVGKLRPVRTTEGSYLYEYRYLTLAEEGQAEAVPLYGATGKLVHPDERRHASIHPHFCRVEYCCYHND